MLRLEQKLPWHIPLIFALTFFVQYVDRYAISIALPLTGQEYQWTAAQIGAYSHYLLAVFSLSFGLSQMLLAGAAERFGAKRSLVVAIVLSSAVTMLTGPLGVSFAALIALQLALGLAASMHVPMMSVITARHFPDAVRARANALWSVGLIIATAIGPMLAVPLMYAQGWRTGFVILGGLSLLITLPLVVFFVRDRSQVAAPHEQVQQRFKPKADFWVYVFCGVLNAFCAFAIFGWLPTYLVRAKGIDFGALGWPLGIIFTAAVAATLSLAWLGDKVHRRVGFASFGLLAAAFMLLFAIDAQALWSVVALFALAAFFQSAFTAQEYATVQRLASDTNVGAATGLYSGISVLIGGFGGSLIPGAIVASTGSFDLALLAIASVAGVAALAMGVLSFILRESADV